MRNLAALLIAIFTVIASSSRANAWPDDRTYYGPVYRREPRVEWRPSPWAHRWYAHRFVWRVNRDPVYVYQPPVERQTTIIYQQAPETAPVTSAPPPLEPPYPPAKSSTAPSGDVAPPAASGYYYFCESSQLYYPYAKTCSERWKAVAPAP